MRGNQLDGSLQQQSGGLTVSITDNSATWGIRRGSGDSGDFERRGVYPCGVDIEGVRYTGAS
jgi:hypothetical protein